eukprot:Hpha_TRINITY_DN16679_c4_g1::TRINITY_DN16679_c4_g1_i1::g.181121::m.181121
MKTWQSMGRTQSNWMRRWYLRSSDWIMRDSDTPEDVNIKRVLAPVFTALGLWFSATMTLGTIRAETDERDRVNLVIVVGFGCFIFGVIQFLVQGCLGKDMRSSLQVFIVCAVVGCVLGDARQASEMRDRFWPLVILIFDGALLFNVHAAFQAFAVSGILVYLLVAYVEAGWRFGLYDIVAVVSPPTCDCADPPCSKGVLSIANWTIAAGMLLTDFHLTRGFANDLRCQLRRIEASVDIAGEVTSALARYDIDLAESVITQGDDDLPHELADSYLSLLSNLRLYREYLPDALLHDQDGMSPRQNSSVPPPVLSEDGEVEVGMVFTDIQSSTALWGAY